MVGGWFEDAGGVNIEKTIKKGEPQHACFHVSVGFCFKNKKTIHFKCDIKKNSLQKILENSTNSQQFCL